MNMDHRTFDENVFEMKSADDEGDENAIVTKALEDFTTAFEAKIADAEKKAADRLAKLEAKLNRPAVHTDADEPTVERKAFATFLRTGTMPLEAKGLNSVSVPSTGGYLAPKDFTTDLVRDLTLFSPIRTIASVRSTSFYSVLIPTRTGITSATWGSEAEASTGSNPSFGQLEIPVRELKTHTDVTNQLLQDAAIDVEAEVRLALAETFGREEAKAFVNGDPTVNPLVPEGFMKNPVVPVFMNGHATTLSPDALVKLVYKLAPQYRSRGTWVMNGATIAIVRTLKDTTGRFLWADSLVAGQPPTLLGFPVVEMVDMPDLAANAFPIVFGDFSTAYRIYDRLEMSVMSNPYLLATSGITRFHAVRRVGAGVVQPLALMKLKMAVS